MMTPNQVQHSIEALERITFAGKFLSEAALQKIATGIQELPQRNRAERRSQAAILRRFARVMARYYVPKAPVSE